MPVALHQVLICVHGKALQGLHSDHRLALDLIRAANPEKEQRAIPKREGCIKQSVYTWLISFTANLLLSLSECRRAKKTGIFNHLVIIITVPSL